LDTDILLNTVFSNILSLCSSLNIRDHILNPCKTRGRILLHSFRQRMRTAPEFDIMYGNKISCCWWLLFLECDTCSLAEVFQRQWRTALLSLDDFSLKCMTFSLGPRHSSSG
jgi:hypothetical protein